MPTPPVHNESQLADAGADSGLPPAETGRARRPSNRTPLPDDLAAAGQQREIDKLRLENQELRTLIEQAIAQEESFDQQLRDATAREVELTTRLQSSSASSGADAEQLITQIQERDEAIRMLTDQIQQLESHVQYAQQTSNNPDHEEILRAIRERDELIHSLTTRVKELERQIADVPPPPPSDEELARMADELEKERCQFTLLRRELEEEKKQHMEESADFERQMREMEVQMSRERAEMARQRTELQRLQTEVHSQVEALQRGDSSLKDRLASLQRRPTDGSSRPPLSTGGAPPTQQQSEKDSGFMKRFFGKK